MRGLQLRALRERPASQQRRVVVSGDDDHLPFGPQGLPERAEHRLGRHHRAARLAMRELDGVAEQDEAVRVGDGGEQPLPDVRDAQDVAPAAIAQVQIGDDERAHGGAR